MEILEILNPWWKEKSIGNALALPYRRKAFSAILKLLNLRQITVIAGLRRVGKSTLMYQAIEELLKTVRPENIMYFSFDERIESILDILKSYAELTKVDWKKQKCFLFFDEVQKLADWSNKIKLIYDAFPHLKIIISGSSSFQLEKEAKVNLAGRHFAINVEPLSFLEYLELRKSKIDVRNISLWEEEIKREYNNYLLRPFPEIVNVDELGLIKSYIMGNVLEKILKVDLSQRFQHVNGDLLSRLVELFYDAPGTYINYDELANDLKVSKKTLIQHMYYLELACVLRKIKNFRPAVRIASRKLQRVYPFHWALQFGWNGKVDSGTIVASLLDARYYWRKDGKEVDFLIVEERITPVEVKESTRVTRSDLKPLLFFMKKFKLNEGFVVYSGVAEKAKFNGCSVSNIPIWRLALNPSSSLSKTPTGP